jgi:uncharacterized protein YjbI with pentapeptide repeats
MVHNYLMARRSFLSFLLCEFCILANFSVCGELNVADILTNKLGKNKNDKNGANVDESSNTFSVSNFDADYFSGDSLNFKGADLANVHLVNATIDGFIPHLAIDTLEIRSETGSISDGNRMAIFDARGGLSTANGVRWDDRKEVLQVQSLASLSSAGIKIDSDIEMNFNTIRNFKLDENSVLKNLRLESSIITDTTLVNATFDDLTLGSVKVDSLSMTSLQKVGSHLIVGEDGNILSSDALHETTDSISVEKKVEFTKSVDFKKSKLENVNIVSGEMDGDNIDLNVRNINTKSMVLKTLKESKNHLKDALVIVRDDGSLTNSNISLEDGWVSDMKVSGSVDFRGKHVVSEERRKPGSILGATIEGGSVKELDDLSVSGSVHFKANLDVKGDAFIDGGLTVGGSVLGSGPYVDVSDKRLKTKVKNISSEGMLESLTKLQAIQYELINGSENESNGEKEIGFIAQDVHEVFPDLVSTRSDGYLGLQYSRFVPLIVEGLKDMQAQIEELQNENQHLKANVDFLMNSL